MKMPFVLFPYKGKVIELSQPKFAYLYYKDRRVNLITGDSESFDISLLLKEWENLNFKQQSESPRVTHLFYELGYLFNGLEELTEDVPLLIDLKFQRIRSKTLLESHPIKLHETSRPLFEDYEKSFRRGQEYLKSGDCYQFNLTAPFEFSFEEKFGPETFASRLWSGENPGAYGSLTYVPYLDQCFLSNSPECLFQIKKLEHEVSIVSMPIKGTEKLSESDNVQEAWERLQTDAKNRGELNMITDLIRNDLSRIERPNAKVLKQFIPLKVPGILHQYSLVEAKLSYDVSLLKILKSLFPGGSVTGAPKKRVMKILKKLEGSSRGFYCGSTLIAWQDFMAASINIRSCRIDVSQQKLTYHAGGGITLLSEAYEEYKEMLVKVESFTRRFL